jgi:hypothetical protein
MATSELPEVPQAEAPVLVLPVQIPNAPPVSPAVVMTIVDGAPVSLTSLLTVVPVLDAFGYRSVSSVSSREHFWHLMLVEVELLIVMFWTVPPLAMEPDIL